MSTKSKPTAPGSALTRRHVFAGAGGIGALAAVAAVLPAARVDATAAAAEVTRPDDGGYRLTEHVKRYYQTARV